MVEISADILMESTSHSEEDIEEARKAMKSIWWQSSCNALLPCNLFN